MSLRPRFAGDGMLRLPRDVAFVADPQIGPPFVRGTRGDAQVDPFERVGSGLLLAEEFARLDLGSAPEIVAFWFQRHGALDLMRLLPSEVTGDMSVAFPDTFRDPLADIAAQQRNVAWHLLSIARLSDHLIALPGRSEGVPWDTTWAQPLLAVGTGFVWLGGYDYQDANLLPEMRTSASPTIDPPQVLDRQTWAEWWARGHAAWREIEAAGTPVVRAVSPAELDVPGLQLAIREVVAGDITEGIEDGPWDLVELQKRLMAPYITSAGEHRVELGWPPKDEWGGPWHPPLVVRERRAWDSILAPIYVQLLEGLRRVTEHLRGGAFCKECGEPFLTLDARRAVFCTDRERTRFGQREHRRRARQAEHFEELEGIDLGEDLDEPGSDEQ